MSKIIYKGWVSCYAHLITINHGVHKTTKGKPALIFNGSRFTLNRRMDNGVCYWRCAKRITPARITTEGNERHWSVKPSVQQCMWLYLCVDKKPNTVSWLSHAFHRILFCSSPCKVCSRVSDALSQALCNLSLAFLADFTLSDSTAPIRFIVKLFSLASYTLLFVWIERQDYSVHTSVLQVQQFTLRAYLFWRHTANGQ